MAVKTQRSNTGIRNIDPRLQILVDDKTSETEVLELIALAHQHLDPRMFNNPDALLAILSRVIHLGQHSEHTQANIMALMEQAAHAQVGRFRKLVRLVLNGALKKLPGKRHQVGAMSFYNGVGDIGDVDRRNQYEVPEDPTNKALFNEVQHGVVHQQGAPYDYEADFYGDDVTRDTTTGWEAQVVTQELSKRAAQAQAIDQGASVNIDDLIEDVDQIMRAWSDDVEIGPSMEESLSPQATR